MRLKSVACLCSQPAQSIETGTYNFCRAAVGQQATAAGAEPLAAVAGSDPAVLELWSLQVTCHCACSEVDIRARRALAALPTHVSVGISFHGA